MKKIVILIPLVSLLLSCTAQEQKPQTETTMKFKVDKSNEEWKKELTPEQYYILREKGTERAHTGEYNMFFEDGTYRCSACNAELFTSDSKFDAHCGWPSFDRAISDSAIVEKADYSHGMVRTEIMCGTCGGHLGHVFNDGPTDTGLRYCVNSISIDFEEEEGEAAAKE
jgi:peptide-methionine (R)-S-oxide reductase